MRFNLKQVAIIFSLLLVSIEMLSCKNSNGLKTKLANTLSSPIDSFINQKEKSEILDVLRKLTLARLGIPTKFIVQNLQKRNEWVLIQVRPVNTDGSEIDYKHTLLYKADAYKDMLDADLFDDHILALLKCTNKQWQLVEYEIGSTDYAGQYWLEQKGIDTLFQ
jgi:hypothetical protein